MAEKKETKKKVVKKKVEIIDLPLEEVEVISNKVEENIKSGETSLAVFSPLKTEVNKVVEFLSGIEIKSPEEMTEDDLKQYKKFRTGVNKVLKFVEDRRKDITSKLMDLKEGFMEEEKSIIKELSEKGLEFKSLIDEKVELDKIEERKILLPIRKKKLTLIEVELPDEKLLEMDEKEFSEFYNEKMEAKLEADKLEKERIEREENIRKEAEAKARKDAEEKAEAKRLKDLEDARILAEKEKNDAVEKAKADTKKEIEEDREEIAEAPKSPESVENKGEEVANGKEEENKGSSEIEDNLKKFLAENNYNAETDIIRQTPTEYKLYRVIKVLKK